MALSLNKYTREVMKQQRSKEMDETGKMMRRETEIFSRLLLEYRVFDDGGHFENYCLGYLRGKVSNKPLRAYFARKIYEYLAEYPRCKTYFEEFKASETLFFQKIPFLFEVIITIQYLDNQILDEKYEVHLVKKHKVNQNLIIGNLLRELLFVYFEQEIVPCFKKKSDAAILGKTLRNLLLQVDLGQFIDKNHNNFKAWKDNMPRWIGISPLFDDIVAQSIQDIVNQVKSDIPNKTAFIDGYFQRIYLTNVYFFRCIAEVLLTLGKCKESRMKNDILVFSIQFGFMLQIINDYADFAYSENPKEQKDLQTSGKKTTDVFSDLYNKNITLPLLYHLKKGYRRKIEGILAGRISRNKIGKIYPKQILQEIIESGAIYNTALRSIELAEASKSCLDPNNPHSEMLADMCDMAESNKFYKVYFQ